MNNESEGRRGRVGVPPGGWCARGRGDLEYQGINSEIAGHHRGASGLTYNI